MAIAFGALGAKATTGTATIAIAHPASVGAADLLLACRNVWLNTATASDETGWTAAGDLAGGTGGAVNDAHSTRVRADYRVAAGGETGTVTFDQGGTVNGVIGVMARYTKDAGATWDVAAQTGDDATHGADRAVTLGSAHTVAVGDWVVAVVAQDLQTAATVTATAFTGTATFGTITRRTSGTGTTTGVNGNIEVYDAEVTGAGTCTGFTITTTASQCGPVDIVRLREVTVATARLRRTVVSNPAAYRASRF